MAISFALLIGKLDNVFQGFRPVGQLSAAFPTYPEERPKRHPLLLLAPAARTLLASIVANGVPAAVGLLLIIGGELKRALVSHVDARQPAPAPLEGGPLGGLTNSVG